MIRAAKYVVAYLICAAALALAGCGAENVKLKLLAGTASSVASGWRVYNTVDEQRQASIRLLAKADPDAAKMKQAEHKAKRGLLEVSLDSATLLIEKIDAQGFTADLVAPLTRVAAELAVAIKAYQEVR